jgi:hypothetical protein
MQKEKKDIALPKTLKPCKRRPKQSPLGCALSTNSKNESRWLCARAKAPQRGVTPGAPPVAEVQAETVHRI